MQAKLASPALPLAHGYSKTLVLSFQKNPNKTLLHYNLRSITSVATKVHMILRGFVVVMWMRDTSELV